jgi:Spy/CpxP family protein refolding chaperone
VTLERSLRTFVVAAVVVLSAVAALTTAAPASAATPCGKKVLADWFDNGRIDRLYPLNC